MPITIERADAELFEMAGKGDFSFMVEAYLEPAFGKPVAEWKRLPVAPYTKTYNAIGDEEREEWADKEIAFFVAMLDATPIGRLSVTPNWNGYGMLDHFGVDKAHRSGGTGQALLADARAWAQDTGLPGLALETQNNNLAACRFYERQGFELGGIDHFFYRGLDPDTREIALFWYLPFGEKL